MDFGIPPTGSSQNYTRSYYMSGRDYVISGSCDEHVVRICCANTGRRLRDVSLEVCRIFYPFSHRLFWLSMIMRVIAALKALFNICYYDHIFHNLMDIFGFIYQGKGAGASMFVQSLRGDPFRVSFSQLISLRVLFLCHTILEFYFSNSQFKIYGLFNFVVYGSRKLPLIFKVVRNVLLL